MTPFQHGKNIYILMKEMSLIVTYDIKVSVLMTNTTGAIQTHLQLNAGITDSYHQVRSTILNYVRAQRQFGPTPMDIGQVGKGRRGNKGKYTSPGKRKRELQLRREVRG